MKDLITFLKEEKELLSTKRSIETELSMVNFHYSLNPMFQPLVCINEDLLTEVNEEIINVRKQIYN